mmetsp:Transcript_8141/g.11680  ORF Transcript_8141/g.11680 Transcript_8141/m.11680 type:complete len:586 (+) Transcript_8141:146-1903(+)
MVNSNVYNLGYATGLKLHQILLHVEDAWKEYRNEEASTEDDHSAMSMEGVLQVTASYLVAYRKWWMNLLTEDPVHLLVETMLLLFVVYLIFRKDTQKGYKTTTAEKGNEYALTEREKDELLREWKKRGREPLAPPSSSDDNEEKMIVEEVHGATLILAGKEKKSVLNFCTFDFLGLACDDDGDDSVKAQSKEALTTYGCGSCGPRGFYGTIDAHLQLEEAMASFLKTDAAILYSDAASASTSAVAAFAKRGDLLIVDESIYEPLRTGVTLSRATVKHFRHNDMDHLENILKHQAEMDSKLHRKNADRRKFIVVEGLYKHSGTLANLTKIMDLKRKFSYRLIIDESHSFGTLGPTGRGALEHFQLKPMYDAEVVIVGLEQSLGSIGGICVGTEEVVDHQRLSGAGYCFSASAPPFTARAALASLTRLQNTEKQLLNKLNANRTLLYQLLGSMLEEMVNKLVITSQDISPIVILQLSPSVIHPTSPNSKSSSTTTTTKPHKLSREEQITLLDTISNTCLDKGIALISTGKSTNAMNKDWETSTHFVTPPPSLKLTVSAVHTKEHLEECVRVLGEVVKEVLGSFGGDV